MPIEWKHLKSPVRELIREFETRSQPNSPSFSRRVEALGITLCVRTTPIVNQTALKEALLDLKKHGGKVFRGLDWSSQYEAKVKRLQRVLTTPDTNSSHFHQHYAEKRIVHSEL